ncbi:MAG TPA: hypothetical protein VFO46_06965 [Candidatus Sulfotelmatobacter sp.]|nr:hypothetical protein [Candidatus Sulfotelmatobacter sp.]
MKSWAKTLCVLYVLCGSALHVFSLDREAFSFTNYNLDLQIDPGQHRLGVRGKITLRNDAATPQKIAVLQISSSLNWRSIRAGDKAVQFVTQPYTSDIDHTGGLSEAIVTLPQAVEPHAAVELEIGYEGVILQDATRLTRIGTPDDLARSTDWDQIDTNFTAVRGVGNVAWYPIAAESANLSEGNDLAEILQRWKAREADSQMSFMFESTKKTTILFSGHPDGFAVTPEEGMVKIGVFSILRLGMNVPTFVLANYKRIDVHGVGAGAVDFIPGKEAAAASYADVLRNLDPLPGANGGPNLQVAELPNPDAAPFLSDNLLLMPFRPLTAEDRLTLVYALARQRATSPRQWISEGLAHYAQALDIDQQHGRKAALDYLNAHASLLVDSEKRFSLSAVTSKEAEGTPASRSLIKTSDEIYLQSKAMWVCWMLHDMIGPSFSMAVSLYQASADKEPSYMPRLIASHTQRDLEWFFDDWVYRDRGLPDFKVDSAFSRSTLTKSYIVAVTIENLGTAGAEVPVIVKFAGGEVGKRLEVRAKSKATIRVETPAPAQEIQVNDGSVPETDVTNNTFKAQPPQN